MATASERPTILIAFGATGDLMARKVLPALYQLSTESQLPAQFQLLGYSRRPLSDEDYRGHVTEALAKKKIHQPVATFLESIGYQQGTFDAAEDYQRLAARIATIEQAWGGVPANRLFYLAVPPELYHRIFQHLDESGLAKRSQAESGWTRVIVEKPFGKDAASAQQLEEELAKRFAEEQIFRIDHYLAKEMLQNILAFRFSNNLFERTWGNHLIERIEIRFLETLTLKDRGDFYDGLGALRDVGQNHFLQMLALLTMNQPLALTAEHVRSRRAEILETLRIPSVASIKADTFRAQHVGYRSLDGVSPDSDTETYFNVTAELTHPKWRGVPILMEGGKSLAEQRKEIIVTLKHPTPCLCPPGIHYRNRIIFSVEPEEQITVEFWAKKPGMAMQLEQRTFDFILRDENDGGQYVEEYKKLLLDCIHGDQLLFISSDEISAMWRFVDPILEAWANNAVPLLEYEPGTQPTLSHETIEQPQALRRTIGVVGLGKMGAGLARNLLDHDWTVHGWNRTHSVARALAADGLTVAPSIEALVAALPTPRLIWLMLPAGQTTEAMIEQLTSLLKPGDTVLDGGNAFFKDSARRAKQLTAKGIHFVDVGVSGGPAGARYGASLMVGGDPADFHRLELLFRHVAVPSGYQFFEGAGAGHFVKMVHNGIEYGMMQAIAEGFAVMKEAPYQLDLGSVTEIYNHGSVVESKLVGWLSSGLRVFGEQLDGVSGTVGHSGEGQWTVDTAKELGIPVPIIEGALEFRKQSEAHPSYTGQLLQTIRNQFGGHTLDPTQKR